ncbi:MAG: hypothetical protein DRO15_01425 [Thermoprotei archaeon]|nr:MAG: hypothetical protein DRO15_01425 [Thermoprotei archaeon]
MRKLEGIMTDIDEILSMTLREFIERHKRELPRYVVVGEDVTFKNILNTLHKSIDYEEKGVEVIVIVDKDRKPIGIIEDLELIEILSSHGRWSLSILRPPIGRKTRKIIDLLNLPIGHIARMFHPVLHADATIKEALDHMDRLRSRYIIVVDEEERLLGVISSRNILSKIIEKLMEM